MKRYPAFMVMLLTAFVAVAEPEEGGLIPPAEEPAVELTAASPAVERQPAALVAFGDVDEALIERAQQWAEANLAIPVPRWVDHPTAQLTSFDEVGDLAASLLEDERFGVVVLWRPVSDVMNHGAFFPERRVSVVNLNAMFTEDTDPEVIERRVERQVIRGICFVMGLEPNPNPHSAMFNYSTLEELDAIGRNLDPPWLVRLQEAAAAAGIPLDPENPFNMIDER
ncbi:MAG TPA: hypothetical protein PKE26_09750 [Kiritimatiellia bacterium]|nr:hypothetical protein [Kiritimatiellia bacterium]HMO99380.1 hypothetical protein [Kiritimatiellia bacterium]